MKPKGGIRMLKYMYGNDCTWQDFSQLNYMNDMAKCAWQKMHQQVSMESDILPDHKVSI